MVCGKQKSMWMWLPGFLLLPGDGDGVYLVAGEAGIALVPVEQQVGMDNPGWRCQGSFPKGICSTFQGREGILSPSMWVYGLDPGISVPLWLPRDAPSA